MQTGIAACACGRRYPIRIGILDFQPPRQGITPAQWTNHVWLTAWGYERFWRKRALTALSGEPFPIEREAALMVALMAPNREGLYLDLACSTALQARFLATYWRSRPTDARVVALDFAWPMLVEAEALIRREGLETVDLVCADAEHLPFLDGSLAGITCGGSLNEFRSPLPVLREVRRVVRDDSCAAFMSLLKGASLLEQVLTQHSGIGFYTLDETERLFQEAGWRVVAKADWGRVAFAKIRPILDKPSINP